MTSSLKSPDSHSSMVATLGRSPWSLAIDIGRTSRREPVRKFSMPFLVDTSFCLRALLPVVFCRLPSVRNWNSGPRARVMAVRKGDMTSSACFMVGAVVIWWVVDVSTFRKKLCRHSAYIDLAAPRATIKYCFVVRRFLMILVTYLSLIHI